MVNCRVGTAASWWERPQASSCKLQAIARPLQHHIAVRNRHQVIGADAERLHVKPALRVQFHLAQQPQVILRLDFHKSAQALYFVQVEFYVFDEIDFPLFLHLHQHAQRCRQQWQQRCARLHLIQQHLRFARLGFVVAAVVDECIFYVALAEFEAAMRHAEVGVGLEICSGQTGGVLQQVGPHRIVLRAARFDFYVDRHGSNVLMMRLHKVGKNRFKPRQKKR